MPEEIYLCGDMALQAGIAIGTGSQGLIASTGLDVKRIRERDDIAAATKAMTLKITEFVGPLSLKPTRLIFEMPTNSKTTHLVPQWSMQVALFLAARTCGFRGEPIGIWPISLKNKATGNAKASKDELMATASEYAGRLIDDDNEADAILLFKIALEFPELLQPRARKAAPKKKKAPAKKPGNSQERDLF